MSNPIKLNLLADVKTAMKAQDKQTVAALRLITAAIKQIEVDERIEVDDNRAISILEKLAKQRQESIQHYKKAERQDLIEQEVFELNLIQKYLPKALSLEETHKIVDLAIEQTKAEKMADIGKIISYIKSNVAERIDMSCVHAYIKIKLS